MSLTIWAQLYMFKSQIALDLGYILIHVIQFPALQRQICSEIYERYEDLT